MANIGNDQIPFLSVAELARLIRARELSPVEATEAYLERIDRIDGRINSYITVCHEEARQAARMRKRPSPLGSTGDRCTACQ